MICSRCNKIISPLTLFNGKWACPKCKKEIVDYNFRIDGTNSEYAEIAKLSYLKALEILGQKKEDTKTLKSYKEYMNTAISNAKKAVDLKNPFGYYYYASFYHHNFIENDDEPLEKAKFVLPYYLAIINTKIDHISIGNDLANKNFNEINTMFESIQERTKFEIESLKSELSQDELSVLGINKDDLVGNSEIKRILSVNTSTRKPILSIFKISSFDLIDVLKAEINLENTYLSCFRIENNSVVRPQFFINTTERLNVIKSWDPQKLNNNGFTNFNNTREFILVILNLESKNKDVKKFISNYLTMIDDESEKVENIIIKYCNNTNLKKTNKKIHIILYEDDIIYNNKLSDLFEYIEKEER